MDWSNITSEQNCWLGDLNVTLPDVNTQDPDVVSAYQSWIKSLVSEFNIDGLRIDGEISICHGDMVACDSPPTFLSSCEVSAGVCAKNNASSECNQACGHGILAPVLWRRGRVLHRRGL